MKKLVLSITAFCAAVSLNAQTVIYSASDIAAFNTFSVVDADTDTYTWGALDMMTANGGSPVGSTFDGQGEVLYSESWNNTDGALTPDNWAIAPPQDLTGYTGCSISLGRAALDPAWPAENFSVYAVTAADVNAALIAFASATPVYTETIATGDEWLVVTGDISALDNTANVYVAIRHHACTDQYLLIVDDVQVLGTAATGSLTENTISVNVYPNPANDILNVTTTGKADRISILSLDGKVVSTQEMNGTSATVNVSDLTSGAYIYEVTAADGSAVRNTFMKK